MSVTLAFAVSSSPAQFVNRALWLGDEVEGVRPNYDRGPDYFIDRMSYVLAPPWKEPVYAPFANRMSFAGGSVTGDELTLENLFHYGVPIGKGFRVNADYLQSENLDTRFQRFATGLEYDVSEPTSVFVQLEGFAEKDRSDASLGAALFRSEASELRVMLTLVDFSADRKSDRIAYSDAPYGLFASGHHGAEGDVQVRYEIGAQLPFTQETRATGDEFSMNRTLADLEVRLPLTDAGTLIVGADFDWTDKELATADTASVLAEDYERNAQRARVEWWHRLGDGHELSAGVSWLRIREDGVRPNDPANSLTDARDELVFLARGRVPLSESWALEPQVFAGHVEIDRRVGGVDSGSSTDGFQGKLGVPVVFSFSDAASLLVNVSVQLDEATFGGGGVAFFASF